MILSELRAGRVRYCSGMLMQVGRTQCRLSLIGFRGGILMSSHPHITLMLSLSLCHTPHHGFRKTDNVDDGSFAASLPPVHPRAGVWRLL